LREAPSIIIINELIKMGAKISAYDPEAMDMAKNFWLKDLDIDYKSSKLIL